MADIRTLLGNIDSPVKASEIVTTGVHPLRMEDTVWDDLTIPMSAMDTNNPNPPVWRKMIGPENLSSSHYLSVTADGTFANVPINSTNDPANVSNDWTMSFWIKPEKRNTAELYAQGIFNVWVGASNRLFFKWGTQSRRTLQSPVVYGSWYNIIIRVDRTVGTEERLVRVYLNGVRKVSSRYTEALVTPPSAKYDICEGGASAFDNLVMYNFKASNAQLDELWNGGNGRTANVTTDGTTPVADTTVLMRLACDSSTGTAVLNTGYDDGVTTPPDGVITGGDYAWPTGGISDDFNARAGLKAPFFEPYDDQEFQFSEQKLHYFAIEGQFIARLHLHIRLDGAWDLDNLEALLPGFKCEFSVNNVFEDEANTITIASKGILFSHENNERTGTGRRHAIVIFHLPITGEPVKQTDDITKTNADNDVQESCMISGRIYRDSADGSDYGVFLKQADMHITKDKLGSAFEWHD